MGWVPELIQLWWQRENIPAPADNQTLVIQPLAALKMINEVKEKLCNKRKEI